jgi:hypothetical protein
LNRTSKYNYEQTITSIKDIESCFDRLEDEGLKKIANIAINNMQHVVTGLALPQVLLMESIRRSKQINYLIYASKASKISLDTNNDDEKEVLMKIVSEKLEKEQMKISNEAIKLLESFKEISLVENAIRIQALNSLVNIWTIFESCTKEIWKYLLNNYQSNFLSNILKESEKSNIDGISGKTISIELLGKYDFNLNNKLGEILSDKFDFTSCSGIKKAFIALDKKKKDNLIFLDNPIAYKLEITRNLIVHNAGIIDNEYLKKTSIPNQTFGELIDLNIEQYNEFEECISLTIIEILDYCEETIKRIKK